MSFGKRGRDDPEMGSEFPKREYAHAIATALRKNLGGTRRAIKTIVAWTGASERTAKSWLSGTAGPNGENLIVLMKQSDEVLETVLRLSGKEAILDAANVLQARDRLIEALEALRATALF